jgi:hypothetical protein
MKKTLKVEEAVLKTAKAASSEQRASWESSLMPHASLPHASMLP